MSDPNNIEQQIVADTHFGFIDRATVAPELRSPKLISNDDSGTMLHAIRHELQRSNRFTFSTAFVTPGALAMLKQDIIDFRGSGLIITSTYLGFNTPEVFYELLNLPGVDVFVHEHSNNFHAKGYVFEQLFSTTAIVGSSNLTGNALIKNKEWNLRFSALPDGDIVQQVTKSIDQQLASSIPLTEQWIDEYARTYAKVPQPTIVTNTSYEALEIQEIQHLFDAPAAIRPNVMQEQALTQIQKVRDAGKKRAMVVSATGTGKTILSALDVKAVNPNKMLFLVHREQILDRAIEEYGRVITDTGIRFGKLAGGHFDRNSDYLFATVQSLSKPNTLHTFNPSHFDYIIIDEVHRAGAETYQRIIDYFKPDFLLGFTATPERSDDINIFELFDYNVPYEIRLQEALENNMLVPFHYYGVTDYQTSDGVTIDETSQLENLIIPERIDHLLKNIEIYGQAGTTVKGLIFCSNIKEALAFETQLNMRKLRGVTLRTKSLTGNHSIQEREQAVQLLEKGKLDYLITVDIFNEGVDIPAVNQVVMMRQTKSSIIFTQQLGRGLRKAAGKEHLIVIDFIGNYANNYLIPIALFGDNSLSKDSIRKNLLDAKEAGVISGVSSVNFDEISRKRIFDSIEKSKLDSMQNLKRVFSDLEHRLGHIPQLIDFARFDTADPVVVSTKSINYWNFLVKIKKTNKSPSLGESAILAFMSKELLNGKRPHELLLLKHLLQHKSITRSEYKTILRSKYCTHDDETINSVSRVLDLTFFTEVQRKLYGNSPIVEMHDDTFHVSDQLSANYEYNYAFKAHLDDAIETGLYLARHKYGWPSSLKIGHRYSRKDVCRILNWASNQEGTIFGYKVDFFSASCPIFITYHKDEDVSHSTRYEDELLNSNTLKWFTRSRRTLGSKEVKSIINNEVPQHLFAKKDDAEGLDFFYLGEVRSSNPVQTTMLDDHGHPLDVVTMHLNLEKPLTQSLYDYLTTPTIA